MKKKVFQWFILSCLGSMIVLSNPAWSMSIEEIFLWVQREYGCEKHYLMPEVQFVSKEKLKKVYRHCNEKTFKKWTGKYGTQKANEIMNYYLSEIIGLCIPETCEVYVGSFLESCKREATVAHELTHYLQIMEQGVIDPKSTGAQDKYLYNEMKAAVVENKFLETFCDPSNPIEHGPIGTRKEQ